MAAMDEPMDWARLAAMSDGCDYCAGYRCPVCTCKADCGARAQDAGVVCGKAPVEVRREWLRATGLYSEAEILRREQ